MCVVVLASFLSLYIYSNYNRALELGMEKYNLPFHPERKQNMVYRANFPVWKKRSTYTCVNVSYFTSKTN